MSNATIVRVGTAIMLALLSLEHAAFVLSGPDGTSPDNVLGLVGLLSVNVLNLLYIGAANDRQ